MQADGSNESWDKFVYRYEHVILEYAVSAGIRRDLAEDLRQTVFTELVGLMPTLIIDPARGSFRSLLRSIVRHRATDLIRNHYRDIDAKAKLESIHTVSEDHRWDLAWETGLMKQALCEVAARVDPATYQAFELTTISEVPAKEVAKLLGMSVDSVYQSKKRVKEAADTQFKRLVEEAEGDLG